MKTDPIEIINSSNCWSDFESFLFKFGNSPQFKKLKGDAFEYLTKYYLLTEPAFSTNFETVLHHSEIPIDIIDDLNLPHPEIGVDLIAKYKEGNYCAIQCKFHQNRNDNVSYDELKTFFSITERNNTYTKLSHRLICTSANKVSNNVRKLHKEKLAFLTHFDFSSLDEERFKQIHKIIKGEKLIFIPYKPRQHQIKAVSAINKKFIQLNVDRGKIIHPCGSGKSLTAYWAAKNLQVRNVIIAVPSLALVKQTLNVWTRQALAEGLGIEYIAICSDQDVSKVDDPAVNTHDIGISVTTNVNKVKKFIESDSKSIKVILITYQSGEVLVSASKLLSFEFDLGIFDEAHKTTGEKTKKFALLLQDSEISIKKKIFMTATERHFKGDSSDLISMDNEQVYGKILHKLSFREALEQDPPILSKYKVTTLIISKNQIESIIANNKFIKANGNNYTFKQDSATIAALIAHRKLSVACKIKHSISFHSSIKRAKEFTDLNNQLNGLPFFKKEIFAFHVSGKMSTSNRNIEIERFCNKNPSIISNARCLTEGVDIPMVDTVVFADPKQSTIDIVQAAGRAMRIHPDKSIGYIIIPVIIDENGSDKVNDAFKQLINVIAALGINDDRIIDEAKEIVKSQFRKSGEIIDFQEFSAEEELDFKEFIDNIKLKIWDRLSFAKSVVGESEFKKWMDTETVLSESSKSKYSNVVRKISNDLIKLNLSFSSLEEITQSADLEKLKEKYFSIEEYRNSDKTGNRMYSAGFNRLIEFQKFKKKTNKD